MRIKTKNKGCPEEGYANGSHTPLIWEDIRTVRI